MLTTAARASLTRWCYPFLRARSLSALQEGEGGAQRGALGGRGGSQQALWNPPPHPNPLRPQGRRGSRSGAAKLYPSTERSPPYRLFHRVQLFPRVLDHRDRRDLDIGELAVHLLGPTDIDVLHDIAGRRIDLDRAPWAVRVLPFFEEFHCLVGGELAVGRLDEVEQRHHAVPGTNRQEVGVRVLAVFLVPRGDEGLVGRPIAGSGIGPGGDDAERRVAHIGQRLIRQ